MLSLDQLTRVVTRDEAMAQTIAQLQALGFAATSWQEGSWPRTMLEGFARVYSAVTLTIADIARGGFNQTATGDWLTWLSKSHYDHDRKPAITTQGTVTLTAAATAGPYTVQPGELVLTTASGVQFRNVDAFDVEPGLTLQVAVEAVAPGAAGDVPVGSITTLVTALAGVTVRNPAAHGSTWITRNGADEEADEALRERNRSKWGAIGSSDAMPVRGYRYHALQSLAAVRRAYVDADSAAAGPGSIIVYVAGDAGPLSTVVTDHVQSYLHGGVDGIDRTASGAKVEVRSAVRRAVPIRGTVYLLSAYNTKTTQRAIVQGLTDYFRALPIGGMRTVPGAVGVVAYGPLHQAVLKTPGVRNVVFSGLSADLPLEPSDVAVPVVNLSFVGVAG